MIENVHPGVPHLFFLSGFCANMTSDIHQNKLILSPEDQSYDLKKIKLELSLRCCSSELNMYKLKLV